MFTRFDFMSIPEGFFQEIIASKKSSITPIESALRHRMPTVTVSFSA